MADLLFGWIGFNHASKDLFNICKEAKSKQVKPEVSCTYGDAPPISEYSLG